MAAGDLARAADSIGQEEAGGSGVGVAPANLSGDGRVGGKISQPLEVVSKSRHFLSEATLLAWECSIAFRELMHIVGCEIIVATLKKTKGNQCHAARKLGMHRNTLAHWIEQAEELGMQVPRWQGPPPRKPVMAEPLLARSAAAGGRGE